VLLVETVEDVPKIEVQDENALAFCTQTTLSVDDTAGIVEALQAKFPAIKGPRKEDICYATTNRQMAVKEIAAGSDYMLVLGAPNSSNSNRLVEVARNYGCPRAKLVQRAAEIDWAAEMAGVKVLGITAGASAPDVLVEEVIAAAKLHFDVRLEEVTLAQEDVIFKLPKAVAVA
jgi:4-hydroxy-3-methylbut-2-enyl diphosphate reductase